MAVFEQTVSQVSSRTALGCQHRINLTRDKVEDGGRVGEGEGEENVLGNDHVRTRLVLFSRTRPHQKCSVFGVEVISVIIGVLQVFR